MRQLIIIILALLLPGMEWVRGEVPVEFRDFPTNTWRKLTPLETTPVSPRLGYEGACVWDSWRQRMIRYGGHNQGGGGEQHSEIWTFDPLTARWDHHEPNTSPPGICCGQQNVFDPTSGLYIRFPAFSGSHGWQWFREIYLNDSSVWTYDLPSNTWRNRRPLPAPQPRPLRCASWDSEHEVMVIFGGEGSQDGTWTYDPYVNEWMKKSPDIEPPGRSGGNMAYDAAARKHVLFGTQFGVDPYTWLYDLNTNTWDRIEPEVQPTTSENDAVLTYDPGSQRVLCIVRSRSGDGEGATSWLETWAFDTVNQQWKKLNPEREPDPSGNRARQFMFIPEWNLALLENVVEPREGSSREQQVWTYRLAESSQNTDQGLRAINRRRELPPPLVEDLVVSVLAKDRVELQWPQLEELEGLDGNAIAGYEVQRAVVEVLSEDQLTRLKAQTPPLEHPSVGAIRRIGPFETLTDTPVREPTFLDTSLDLTQPQAIEGTPTYDRRWHDEQLDGSGRAYRFAVYAYRVRAINGAGVAGGWSAATLTIPSAPQYLFSREVGESCHLRWHENAEQGITGYRVYRMNGRYTSDEIPRLTSEPITATTFTDETAGKRTRRYYVVAVDALGQEGFPSSPVWFEREWKPFYAPFTGDWHQ